MTTAPQTLPARRGKAVRLRRGQALKVINTHGQQVVDTWAFNADDLAEFMSMEHLRQVLSRIMPRVGDPLATNRRRPILTLRRGHLARHPRHADRGLRRLALPQPRLHRATTTTAGTTCSPAWPSSA